MYITAQISLGKMSFMLLPLGKKVLIGTFKGYLECSIKDLLTLNLISQNAQILLEQISIGKMSFMQVSLGQKVFH